MIMEFTTSRLTVSEISGDIAQLELTELFDRVAELLTPSVVKNLPPYFHGVTSQSDAQRWFERMVSESRLFVVKHNGLDTIIGFLFAYVEHDFDAHIGYLLGESYWGKGYASELLSGFINKASEETKWVKLVGGVDKSNKASSCLLLKLGFVEQSDDGLVVFYDYPLTENTPTCEGVKKS